MATEPYIGLKSTHEALFFIITGPVGAYYPEGFNPVKITVSDEYSRAGPGGLGSAKTAANYAASLKAEKEALARGFTQVLWLDAAERRYIEEVGSEDRRNNRPICVVGGVLVWPLSGSLPAQAWTIGGRFDAIGRPCDRISARASVTRRAPRPE